MTALTRIHFNSSSLMRALASLDVLDSAEVGAAFGERLGQWVSFTDAIGLSALHNQSYAAPAQNLAALTPQNRQQPTGVHEEVDQTQATLSQLIRRSMQASRANAPMVSLQLPDPPEGASMALGAAAFEPYRRFYTAHQRKMESTLPPLRAKARTLLAQDGSPALRQLAALDGAMETILVERESKLLTKVTALLQKRFMHLLRTHQQTHASLQQDGNAPADTATQWLLPGAWLTRFIAELQTVLLAELDLRLQPTRGLLEAYQHAT